MSRRVGTALVARLDNDGDVLLAGPAIRAVAAHAEEVVLLCGPRGRQAAALLPDVGDVVEWRCPWIDPEPPPVERADIDGVAASIAARKVDAALVLTSFHQSALPTALLLRLAGVRWIGAVSEDYPGSLLDLRHRPSADGHEVDRMLDLAAAAGFRLPATDDGRLALRRPLPDTVPLTAPFTDGSPYVVVHPGASVPARAPSQQWMARAVQALQDAGWRVVVTGGPNERALTSAVAGSDALDLGGAVSFAQLADVLARAAAVVVGNTGPAHLAAAVGTPVVSLFAPVVPLQRWRPHSVPVVVLGDQQAGCAGSRARTCPLPGHPCLDGVPPGDVVSAVAALAPSAGPAEVGGTEVA